MKRFEDFVLEGRTGSVVPVRVDGRVVRVTCAVEVRVVDGAVRVSFTPTTGPDMDGVDAAIALRRDSADLERELVRSLGPVKRVRWDGPVSFDLREELVSGLVLRAMGVA